MVSSSYELDKINKNILSKPIEVSLSQLRLKDIQFSYHDFRKDTLDFGVDYDHIELKNLQLDADHITSAG